MEVVNLTIKQPFEAHKKQIQDKITQEALASASAFSGNGPADPLYPLTPPSADPDLERDSDDQSFSFENANQECR